MSRLEYIAAPPTTMTGASAASTGARIVQEHQVIRRGRCVGCTAPRRVPRCSKTELREKSVDMRDPQAAAARKQLMAVAVRQRIGHDEFGAAAALRECAMPGARPFRSPVQVVFRIEPQARHARRLAVTS